MCHRLAYTVPWKTCLIFHCSSIFVDIANSVPCDEVLMRLGPTLHRLCNRTHPELCVTTATCNHLPFAPHLPSSPNYHLHPTEVSTNICACSCDYISRSWFVVQPTSYLPTIRLPRTAQSGSPDTIARRVHHRMSFIKTPTQARRTAEHTALKERVLYLSVNAPRK